MPDEEEQILVIPRPLFDRLGSFQGLEFDIDRYLPAMLSPENNHFVARSAAEQDPSLKQIIPYAILTHAGRVLHYVRGKKGGESRLHAMGSIGIGGHVNSNDSTRGGGWDSSTYHLAVRRELNEELQLDTTWSESIVALLNDDSNPVGQVHLGVVHRFKLDSDRVASNEDEITQLEFLTPAELLALRDRMESWSQICLDHLDSLVP